MLSDAGALDPADETCREYERVVDAKYLDQIRTEAKHFSNKLLSRQSGVARCAIMNFKKGKNRLVCRPSRRLRQKAFRTSLIPAGPYPGDEFRSHRAPRSRAETSTPSACARPHPVQHRVLSIFSISSDRGAKAGVNCSGQGLHATNPRPEPRMSIVLSTAAGPTPKPPSRTDLNAVDDWQVTSGNLVFILYFFFSVTGFRVVKEFPVLRNTPVDAVS
jgi:hypothetical protein